MAIWIMRKSKIIYIFLVSLTVMLWFFICSPAQELSQYYSSCKFLMKRTLFWFYFVVIYWLIFNFCLITFKRIVFQLIWVTLCRTKLIGPSFESLSVTSPMKKRIISKEAKECMNDRSWVEYWTRYILCHLNSEKPVNERKTLEFHGYSLESNVFSLFLTQFHNFMLIWFILLSRRHCK